MRTVDAAYKISILIAVRNEEEDIINCLQSITELDYPENLIEVLIGNDQSTDKSEELINEFIRERKNFKLFNIHSCIGKARGKANVLAQLAQKATGNFYFIADADVVVQPLWLKGLLAGCNKGTGIVSGITLIEGNDYFSGFQCMDMAYAFGMVKIVSDFKIPVTAIGNNMVVSGKAYKSTGGYENIPFSITEDYMLFREIIKHKYNFANMVQPEVLSFSKPVKNFYALLEQRMRWMMGAKKLPIFLFVSLTIQAIFFPIVLLTLFFFPFWGIVVWLIKIILQNLFIASVLKKVKYNFRLRKYFLLYEFYSGILSVSLLLYFFIPRKINWKGREYTRE